MRYKFFFLLLFSFINLFISKAQEKTISVPANFIGNISIASDAYKLENTSRSITIDSLVNYPNRYEFKRISSAKEDLGFTNSEFWIKFKILYTGTSEKTFYLETVRAVTNIAELYHVKPEGYNVSFSGDGIPFINKDVKHRNTVFHIALKPMQVNTFFLKVGSDGEVLSLPMKLWSPESFWKRDYKEQYILGIYYGILLFVSLIYFFFYTTLKERSFLYYVLYVLGVAALQFSLDGFFAQYIFNNNVWWANHITLFSAALGLFFVVNYVRSFLNTKERDPKTDKVLLVLICIDIVCVAFMFTEGALYSIAFPLINILSLIGIFIILASIIRIRKKKIYVCPYFISAFIFLTLGIAIFILNNFDIIPSSFFTENGMKLGTGMEVIFLSFSMANKFRDLQKDKEKAQAETLEKLLEMNKLKDDININLEHQVKERTKEIKKQKEIIEEKNKDITDSINYARGIQNATLSDTKELTSVFPDSFVLFKPKDIVSGDFYRFANKGNEILVAAVDCTGHGVPGALMSMLGNSILNEIINEKNILNPDRILYEMRERVIQTLNKDSDVEKQDGMDIALYNINKETLMLKYSGAYNPLWIIRNGNIIEIKADKFPIGKMEGRDQNYFTANEYQLHKNDCIYVFTDGYADQFGGEFGKKIKYRRLQELLLNAKMMSMENQKNLLDSTIEKWKGDFDQVDDILIIGVRI